MQNVEKPFGKVRTDGLTLISKEQNSFLERYDKINDSVRFQTLTLLTFLKFELWLRLWLYLLFVTMMKSLN